MQISDNHKPKRDSDNVQCFDCKEFGHYKRACPNKKGKIINNCETKHVPEVLNVQMNEMQKKFFFFSHFGDAV